MCAFAANSLLSRAALAEPSIDAASFTVVRLISGAIVLWLLTVRSRGAPAAARDWPAVAALCVYAITFSFAYVSLGAGTGALILFGAAQITMLAAGSARASGSRPRRGRGSRWPWPAWRISSHRACARRRRSGRC